MGGASSKKHLETYLANQTQVKHWGVAHTCTLTEWTKHQAGVWGFEPCINYSTRQESRLQPWATKGRHFVAQIPAPETQDIDMSAARMYATMAIEEKRNKYQVQCVDLPYSYFKDGVHFVEVVAYRDTHAVVQVSTKHQRMDFLLVDMEHDTVLLIHREFLQGKPYLFEGTISPDYTRVLLKPNHYYAHFHNVQIIRDLVQIIAADEKVNSKLNRRMSQRRGTSSGVLNRANSVTGSRKGRDVEIENIDEADCNDYTIHETEALRMAMTFDPRYRHSRVILANVVENGKPIILMYDIEKRERVLQNDLHTNTERIALNIVFSPGGNFIAVPLIVGDYQTTPPFVISDIRLYNANTLDCVYTLPPIGLPGGYVSLVPLGLFPMFSASGAFLAVPVSKSHPESVYQRGQFLRVGSVAIHKVAPLMHLQSMCRTRIRQCMKSNLIPRLPLPEALKRFLLFKPFLD